ncbi:MAG: hypothetical protein K6C97_12240 [Treponema sp.]|nr:hypothetical protein [Treponema sp.]
MSENVDSPAEGKIPETGIENNIKTDKKKKPVIVKILLGILYFILAILLVFIAWMTFCAFQRDSSVKALPSNYSLYIRTDSIYHAAEPLIDLKAMDVVLAEPDFTSFRDTFYTIRESKLRKNKLLAFALSRKVDAALYENNNYLAVIDMGILSGISRLVPFATNFAEIKNLTYIKSDDGNYFEYAANEKLTIYIKIRKNLIIISGNKELFDNAVLFDNTQNYSKEDLQLFKEKLTQPFRIVANGKKLLSLMGEENPYINFIAASLSEEELSKIEFGISDENINLQFKLPFNKVDEENTNGLVALIQKKSEVPDILPKLPSSVQYFTIINFGNLSELKEAAFTIMDEGQKDVKKLWDDANAISKVLFKDTLDNILFSWTSDEYSVIGLEGKPDPVFVLKVSDEERRQIVFESLISSIILQTDNSLLLDGVRLPRIEFPEFIRNLLKAFNINLPKPYYMVKDGFIYFSQSPENLVSINAALKNGAKLDKDEIWQKVSGNKLNPASLSLYYNLERSIPFFVKGNGLFNKILQLYNIGKVDLSTKDSVINVSLHAISCESSQTQKVEGFPIELEGNAIPILYKSNNEKGKLIYWQQKPNLIKVINTGSLEIKQREIDSISYIVPASKNTYKSCKGDLWAITKDGLIYLLDENFEDVSGFPMMSGIEIACQPAIYNDNLLLIDQENLLYLINEKAESSQLDFEIFDQVRNTPCVYKDYLALYEKGFLGGIHLIFKKGEELEDTLIPVDGIGFGSPCLFEEKGKLYVSFITQAGDLYIWNEEGELKEAFPLTLDGVFFLNVRFVNGALIALAEDGTLYKVELDGQITKVKIPNLSAKSGYITITDYDGDKKDDIFLCGESNAIYGLSSDLEYLNAFPITGYGCPVFLDLNGDKKVDSISLSIDNKLNAWKLY